MAEQPHVWTDRRRNETYKRISSGVFLLCVGGVLLLNTLEVLDWGVWFELVRLWPLLLISLGIRLVFANTPVHFLSVLGPGLVAFGFFATAGAHQDRADPWDGGFDADGTVAMSCPAGSRAMPVRLDLRFASGSMRLTGTAPREEAMSGLKGSVRYTGEAPRFQCDDDGALRLGDRRAGGTIHVILPFRGGRAQWDATLAASAPVELRAGVAAASAEIDLRQFRLKDVGLEARAADVLLRLPAPAGRVRLRADGAVSRLRILLPENACYEIERDRRATLIDADDAGGGRCEDLYDIWVDLPLSAVSVKTEP